MNDTVAFLAKATCRDQRLLQGLQDAEFDKSCDAVLECAFGANLADNTDLVAGCTGVGCGARRGLPDEMMLR